MNNILKTLWASPMVLAAIIATPLSVILFIDKEAGLIALDVYAWAAAATLLGAISYYLYKNRS